MATLRSVASSGVANRCHAVCGRITRIEGTRLSRPLNQQCRSFRTSRIQRLDEDTDLATLRKWDKMFEKLGLNTYRETFNKKLMTDRQLRQKAATRRKKIFRVAAYEAGIPFQKTEEEYNALLRAQKTQRVEDTAADSGGRIGGASPTPKENTTNSRTQENNTTTPQVDKVDSTKMLGASAAASAGASAVDWDRDTSSDEQTQTDEDRSNEEDDEFDNEEGFANQREFEQKFGSQGYGLEEDMYDSDGNPLLHSTKDEVDAEREGTLRRYRLLEKWAEDMDPEDAKRVLAEFWAEEKLNKEKAQEGLKGSESGEDNEYESESENANRSEYGEDLEQVGDSEDEAERYRELFGYQEGEQDVSDGEATIRAEAEKKRLRAERNRRREEELMMEDEEEGEDDENFDEDGENMFEIEGSGDEDIGFSEDEQDQEAEQDLIDDEDFHSDLTMRLIETKRVVNQTGGGKIQSFVSIVAVGNGAGALGFSTGKSYTPDLSVDKAFRRAIRKLVHVRRYNDHTITHPIYVKFKKTRLYLRPSRVGHGTVAHEIVQDLCELAGVHDISSNIVGSTIPLNIVKAFFIAISKHRTVEDIAKGRGRNIVEFKRSVEVRG